MVSRLLRLVHRLGRSVVDRSVGRSSVSMIFACSVFCSYLETVYSYNYSRSSRKLMSISVNKTIMRSSFSTNYCIRFELHLIGLRHIINKRKSSRCLCVCVCGCQVRYPRCHQLLQGGHPTSVDGGLLDHQQDGRLHRGRRRGL